MKISTVNRELFIRLSDLHRPNTIRLSGRSRISGCIPCRTGPSLSSSDRPGPQYVTEHYLIQERPAPKSLSLYTVQYIRAALWVWYTHYVTHAHSRDWRYLRQNRLGGHGPNYIRYPIKSTEHFVVCRNSFGIFYISISFLWFEFRIERKWF